MNTPWQIQLFGGLSARQDDHVITRFATAKTAALLACLALHPKRSHSREELADMLWPDVDLDAGRQSLRQALASLRRQLEPPGTPSGSILIADRQSIRLNPSTIATDVAAFEAFLKAAHHSADPVMRRRSLERAVELYHGELLPGFYEDWIISERERLAFAYEGAVEDLASLRPDVLTIPPDAPGDTPAPSPPSTSSASRLPIQFTRFFGREAEMARLGALVLDAQVRLVTLTGSGGTGKTRLAIEAARRIPECAAFFVPLADLMDASLIPSAVAAALRVPIAEGQDTLEQVVVALSSYLRPVLLLDNLEQLAEDAAAVVMRLLTLSPHLTCLVTSRQRLELAGEREFLLSPLPIPAETASAETLAAVPSVQLFVDRAQAARPDFQVTPRNAHAVADLCRRLDGLPLALELAAAWSPVLTPSQMLERLDSQFEFLVSRRKDLPPQRRTLWAAIGWSYDLLPQDLQRFWTGLSVFRGGWTAEAAQSVCEEAQALHSLTQLRARSLILLDGGDSEIRFRMPEMLREFAWGQMTQVEREKLGRRHTGYFQALVETAKSHMKGPEQAVWLGRLETEHDNLRTALDRLCASPDGLADEMRLTGALYDFWYLHGHIREAQARYAALLARTGVENTPPQAYGKVLNSAGLTAAWLGELDEAQALFERHLTLHRTVGDDEGVAVAFVSLALVARRRGDNEAALAWGEQALAARRRQGDEYAVAVSLANLGVTYARLDRMADAERALTEGLLLSRRLGDWTHTGRILNNLGAVYLGQGKTENARACWSESLSLVQAAGSLPNLLPPLLNLANLDQLAGLWERAARMRGAVSALSAKHGLTFASQDRAGLEERYAALKAQMGEDAFTRTWAEGEAMSLDETIELTLSKPTISP